MKRFLIVLLVLFGLTPVVFAQEPGQPTQVGEVSYNFPLDGWYLISVPIVPLYTKNIFELFPGVERVVRWDKEKQEYKELTPSDCFSCWSPKEGLWVKMEGGSTATIDGYPISLYSVGLSQDWNLIGGIYQRSVSIANPADNPDGSVMAFFGYDMNVFGYYPAGMIDPQKGYWVYAAQPCQLAIGDNIPAEPGQQPGKLGKATGFTPPPPPWLVSGVETEKTVPKNFSLSQNYPNPFNPTTEISFNLATTSVVQLTVYNIAGQKVATLVNTRMAAGRHTVTWNGKNDSGQPVNSGMYIYQIKAGSFEATKKMTLLK